MKWDAEFQPLVRLINWWPPLYAGGLGAAFELGRLFPTQQPWRTLLALGICVGIVTGVGGLMRKLR